MRLTQNIASVALERAPVRITDITEKADNAALRRSPWEERQRIRVGEQEQVGGLDVHKSFDRRCVKGDAGLKGAAELARGDGDILLCAEDITKGQTDKLDVVLLDKLLNF